jgi:YegS/Rv2252/BmrU family lipid kinase
VTAEPVWLLVNPASGAGRAQRRLPEVQAELERLGMGTEVHTSLNVEHAARIAREAAEGGTTLVVCGGDGLLRIAAQALAGSEATLGILPGGRGNDFARALGVPLDAIQACRVVAAGRVRAVDVGDVDGRVFLGVASCGLDSDVNKRANEARIIRGRFVYVSSLFAALARWRPVEFSLTLDGRAVAYRGYTVAVGNSGRYGGGVRIAPAALLDDGLLDVITAREASRLRYLAMLPRAFSGRHVDGEWVQAERARVVRIDADRPLVIYADGDPIGTTPATVGVRPGALWVLAPPDPGNGGASTSARG